MSDGTTAIESAAMGGSKDPGKSRLSIAVKKNDWLSRLSDYAGEYCSSILVKETRQALKSRQFIWTYFLLLFCVGVWTVLGLTLNAGAYETGRVLLVGFWWILGFPLCLIIPFSAYRSMAREFEDGTIQLVSITTMRPYQIVIGKFGSAILQMLVYLSVLAPCIAFTYLLRGVSLDQIILGLGIGICGSLCLTVLGLFLAGAFQSRTLGVGTSVLFVLLLGGLYLAWCGLIAELTYYGYGIWDNSESTIVAFMFFVIFGSTAALLMVTAVSQISFASDNRSTGIRIMMLVQQMLFVSLMIVFLPIITYALDEAFIVWSFVAGHYWLGMGFLMIGESSTLSRRVQRTLPRTLFARTFFSLLMPGAGRGFLFAVANVWACCLMMLAVGFFRDHLISQEALDQYFANNGGPTAGISGSVLSIENVLSVIINGLFVTWFLALNYLLTRRFFAKRRKEWAPGTGPMVSLVLGTLLVITFLIGSTVLHYNIFGYRSDSSPIMVTNWYWATVESAQLGGGFLTYSMWFILFAILAILVIIVALMVASRELLYCPVAIPQRVALELQKNKTPTLAVGESIEEIFGDLELDDKQ